MKTKLSQIHETLAQVRKERGLSQGTVAKRLVLDQTTISLYENGHRGIPLDTLDRWFEILGVTVSISIEGYEPAKEPECEQRDLEEFSQLKRRRNYLIAEMRSLMAQRVMQDPELGAADEESGESQFWPYSFHQDHVIGLVESRFDHPSQRYLAVEYTGEEVNVYRFGESMPSTTPGLAFLGEDDFLTTGDTLAHEDFEALKSTIFRKKASSPDGLELINSEGFPVSSLLVIQKNFERFVTVYDEVIGHENYLTMETELLQIEGRLDTLLLDNRLGNSKPNPAFERWIKADEQAVSVPLYSPERIWHWVEEGVSWVDDCDSEVALNLWVDPKIHERYEVLRDENGDRFIGTIGSDRSPAVFKVNPAKPEIVHRVEVNPKDLTYEESKRYDKVVESSRELDELKETE